MVEVSWAWLQSQSDFVYSLVELVFGKDMRTIANTAKGKQVDIFKEGGMTHVSKSLDFCQVGTYCTNI